MPQIFILNIFSDLFALLINFLLDVSYFSDFPSFCIHIHVAGLRTEYVLVSQIIVVFSKYFIPGDGETNIRLSKRSGGAGCLRLRGKKQLKIHIP